MKKKLYTNFLVISQLTTKIKHIVVIHEKKQYSLNDLIELLEIFTCIGKVMLNG